MEEENVNPKPKPKGKCRRFNLRSPHDRNVSRAQEAPPDKVVDLSGVSLSEDQLCVLALGPSAALPHAPCTINSCRGMDRRAAAVLLDNIHMPVCVCVCVCVCECA